MLARFCGRSQYANQGERVVAGQRLMQAESDIFLGWARATGPDGMTIYARMCAWTLARAHACSGDRIALAAYLGDSGKFDQAIADFAETYADQNERDYAALKAAVQDGRAQATTEI